MPRKPYFAKLNGPSSHSPLPIDTPSAIRLGPMMEARRMRPVTRGAPTTSSGLGRSVTVSGGRLTPIWRSRQPCRPPPYSVARGLMLGPRGPTAKERRLGRREHPRATELRRPAPAAGSHASAIPWGRSSALESKLDGCVDRQRTATSEQLIELGRGEASSAEQLERLRVAPLAPPRHVSSESLRQPA